MKTLTQAEEHLVLSPGVEVVENASLLEQEIKISLIKKSSRKISHSVALGDVSACAAV